MDRLRQLRVIMLTEAALFILLGVLAIFLPVVFTMAINVILGWLLILAGLVQGVSVIQNRDLPGYASRLVMSILALVFGLFLILAPVAGIVTITALLATYLVIEGVIKMMMAMRLREEYSRWFIILLSGLVAFGLGLVLFAGLPAAAFWALGLFLGVNLLFFGLALIALTWEITAPLGRA